MHNGFESRNFQCLSFIPYPLEYGSLLEVVVIFFLYAAYVSLILKNAAFRTDPRINFHPPHHHDQLSYVILPF